MAKKDSVVLNIFKIFGNGLKLYFLNFETFFKYMAFPVFGQIIGATLIFFASYIFTIYVSDLTTKSPIFDNIPIVFLVLRAYTSLIISFISCFESSSICLDLIFVLLCYVFMSVICVFFFLGFYFFFFFFDFL